MSGQEAVPDLRRRFVLVGDRLVHYRHGGDGPPVLLLHDAPGSSRSISLEGRRLTERGLRVLAPDLAGTAMTDLPAGLAVTELVAWMCEVLDALTLDRVHVVGTGAGAVVALALASTDPDRVGGVGIVDLPRLDENERRQRAASEFSSFPPRQDGAHLLTAWHVFRRRYLYDPWYADGADHRVLRDVPEPETLNAHVVGALRAGNRYSALAEAVLDIDVEAMFEAVRKTLGERLVEGDDLVTTALSAVAFEALGDAPPLPAQPEASPHVTTRRYVQTSRGQVHMFEFGSEVPRGNPPLLMIHQSPGTAATVKPLARELRSHRLVLAPDHLGNGDSDPPPSASTEIAFYADVLEEVLNRLGHEQIDVWGSHTGSLIGMELAIRHPRRVRRLVMDGITLFDTDEIEDILAHYFVSTEPDAYGLHLVRTWNVRLDMHLFWPWYRHTAEAANIYPMPSAEQIHEWVLDMLKTGQTWHIAYRAAFRYPTAERLPLLDTPSLLVAGPSDPLARFNARATSLQPDLSIARTAGTATPEALSATAATITAFLDEGK